VKRRRGAAVCLLLCLAAAVYFLTIGKKHAASPNRGPAERITPLDRDFFRACQRGDLAGVKRSLNAGADILSRSDSRTGLFAAIDGGALDVAAFLLAKEKKLAVTPDQYGVKPLGYIVRGYGGFPPAVQKTARLALLDDLIAAGADVDETDGYGYGLSDIFFASGSCAPAMVEALLLRGAQMNHKSAAPYPDSFCDVDFTLPSGSTPLDKFQALLEVVPAQPDFARVRDTIRGVIRVLREHGAVNGAWAEQRRRGKIT
jgi:hypothetical protein